MLISINLNCWVDSNCLISFKIPLNLIVLYGLMLLILSGELFLPISFFVLVYRLKKIKC